MPEEPTCLLAFACVSRQDGQIFWTPARLRGSVRIETAEAASSLGAMLSNQWPELSLNRQEASPKSWAPKSCRLRQVCRVIFETADRIDPETKSGVPS